MQQALRDIAQMQSAVQHSQLKVTEYWQKVQAHENLLMDQRKLILSVENQNEQLKLTKAEASLAMASVTCHVSRSSTTRCLVVCRRARTRCSIGRRARVANGLYCIC
jgi:hypothetical protein